MMNRRGYIPGGLSLFTWPTTRATHPYDKRQLSDLLAPSSYVNSAVIKICAASLVNTLTQKLVDTKMSLDGTELQGSAVYVFGFNFSFNVKNLVIKFLPKTFK